MAGSGPASAVTSGHNHPGCVGRWVDVSTFTKRYRVMCASCRAQRSMRPDEIQSGEFSDFAPKDEPAVPEKEKVGCWTVVVLAAVSGAIGAMLAAYALGILK